MRKGALSLLYSRIAFKADSSLPAGSDFSVALFNTMSGLAQDAGAAFRQILYDRRACATTDVESAPRMGQ